MENNPYVGPRPYERNDRHKFYGRNREARDLLSLLLAERVVLFYAPSGAGKSSLLHATIIPALEEEDFLVLPVTRVGSDFPPAIAPQDVENVFVFSALMGLAGAEMPPATLVGHTLTSFLHHIHADASLGYGKPPVLIVDQFEEILTTHRDRWQDAQGFFEQVRDALREIPTLGVAFAMREDHVAGLDPYVPILPKRLRARFRMERLDRASALEAVKRPAEQAGCTFGEGVAERLVDDLCRIKAHRYGSAAQSEGDLDESILGPFVEPVQLQVVCSRLWENLPEQPDHTIQWEEVERFGDIDRALTDFYEDVLRRCVEKTNVSERVLRRWFRTQLITPMGTRGLVLRGERETGGLPNEAVDVIEAQHLIRAEARAGARWYELSHDRMVDPILRSNREWEAARQTPLRLATQRWRAGGQAQGLLYRDQILRDTLAWADAHPQEIEPDEQEFLEASVRAEAIRKRIRAFQIAGAVAAAIALVVVTTLALVAYRAGRIAESRTLASYSTAYQHIDRISSIALALEGIQEAHTREAEIALRQAVVDYYPAQVLEYTAADHAVSVLYSADGRYLVSTTSDGHIYLWDTSTYQPMMTFTVGGGKPEQWMWGLAFSPDGRYLSTGGPPPIHVWDIANGAEVAALQGHTDLIYSLDYSPDGRYLASGSRDTTVRLWDTATGTNVLTLTSPFGLVTSVDYAPDGRALAFAVRDGSVRVWTLVPTSTTELEARPSLTLTGHTAAVGSVAFSPDGKLIASASDDKTIRIWDATTGKGLMTLVGHADLIMYIAFSHDGQFLASCSRDATVRVWNVGLRRSEASAILVGHTGVVNSVAWSPTDRYLASASSDGTVRVWDLRPPQSARTATLIAHRNTVNDLAYSPDGRYLASASADRTVRFWDTQTNENVAMFSVSGRVWDVTYSPDGRHAVICVADKTARVLDVSHMPDVTPVVTLTGHTGEVNASVYSPDGARLVTVADDMTARIWDTAAWTTLFTLTGHTAAVYNVAYSPDGAWIATGGVDDDVRLWDAETGELEAVLDEHTQDVMSLAFSPDSKWLASASWDNTALLWNLRDYSVAARLTAHNGYVYSVAFTPDGRYLVTTSWDKTTRLWKVPRRPGSAQELDMVAVLFGHTDLVRIAAFSPDGRYLATGSRDGTIRRYLVEFDDVRALAEEFLAAEELAYQMATGDTERIFEGMY